MVLCQDSVMHHFTEVNEGYKTFIWIYTNVRFQPYAHSIPVCLLLASDVNSDCGYMLGCVQFCDLRHWGPPGSSVHGILQAWILEWVAISFSWGFSWPRGWTPISGIGRWVFYHWATWEAQILINKVWKTRVKERVITNLTVSPNLLWKVGGM